MAILSSISPGVFGMSEDGNDNSRIWLFVGRLASVAVIALAAWAWNLEHRVTVLESNQFTASMGDDLMKEITVIKLQMAALPPKYPPESVDKDFEIVRGQYAHLASEFDGLRRDVQRNGERFAAVEAAVRVLSSKVDERPE